MAVIGLGYSPSLNKAVCFLNPQCRKPTRATPHCVPKDGPQNTSGFLTLPFLPSPSSPRRPRRVEGGGQNLAWSNVHATILTLRMPGATRGARSRRSSFHGVTSVSVGYAVASSKKKQLEQATNSHGSKFQDCKHLLTNINNNCVQFLISAGPGPERGKGFCVQVPG